MKMNRSPLNSPREAPSTPPKGELKIATGHAGILCPLSLWRGLGRGFILLSKLSIVNYQLSILVITMIIAMTSCDVHEWPHEEETVPLLLKLEFDTDWDEQDHYFTRSTRVGTKGTITRGETRTGIESRVLGEYDMRYIINAYPVDESGNVSQTIAHQFVFTKAVITDFNYQTEEVRLPEGNYQLMVWADFVTPGTSNDMYYHPASFNSIYLDETHSGNTDYRDAFRGSAQVEMDAVVYDTQTATVTIPMERPMAKFTFVTTDLKEFLEREATRVNRVNRANEADTKDAETKYPDTKDPEKDDETEIQLSDYRVVFYYTGFMPNTYNMFTDKPIDSATGVHFSSTLSQLSDEEASMGFDYVMVNGHDASVMVTVGLFDKDDNALSMSDEINVPLNRSVNTIVRGSFLMQEANGGIGIDPGFEGDHNIIIP